MGNKTKKPVDKTAERFYCPYPHCTRSFAELWRLKVHYRAPPDVRGSGKERGHGQELPACPRCGKTLVPGKHHTGCSSQQAGLLPLPDSEGRDQTAGGHGVKQENVANQESNWHMLQYASTLEGQPLTFPLQQPPHSDPLSWPLPSTCSTSTVVAIDHACSAPVPQRSHTNNVGYRPNNGVVLAPHHAQQPATPQFSHTEVSIHQPMTRTQTWTDRATQTDLSAHIWPLDMPFPALGGAAAPQTSGWPNAALAFVPPPSNAQVPQSGAWNDAGSGYGPPPLPPASEHPHTHASSPYRDIGGGKTLPGAHAHTAAHKRPFSEIDGACVVETSSKAPPPSHVAPPAPGSPHPPSSPPAEDFDDLANMLFDFSHFDQHARKPSCPELTALGAPANGTAEEPDFLDDLYGCDMMHDQGSVFKISFEDALHNPMSITSHMHRRDPSAYVLEDGSALDLALEGH